MATTALSPARRVALLGPAFVAAVAYVDPGNVATNVTAGAIHTYVEGTGLASRFGTNTDGGNYRFCNGNEWTTFQPALERYGAFVTFSQDLWSSAKFEMTALYSRRTQTANQGPFTGSVTAADMPVVASMSCITRPTRASERLSTRCRRGAASWSRSRMSTTL